MKLLRALGRRALSKFPTKHKLLGGRNFPLLQLPIDVLLVILDHLSPCSHTVLSQTCRSLRHILHQGHLRGVTGPDAHIKALSRDQRLDFLFTIARRRPDRWVCHVCLKLHAVHELDIPIAQQHASCHLDASYYLGWRWLEDDGNADSSFVMKHRHFQLALKYSRLASKGKAERRYLKRLLEPCQAPMLCLSDGEEFLSAQYAAFPKIVEGRYMLLSIWHYERESGAEFREVTGSTCHGYETTIWWKRSGNHLEEIFDIKDQVAAVQRIPPEDDEPEEVHFYGSCMVCPTDVSICAAPGRLTMRTWQDFGSEDSWVDQLDPAWSLHAGMLEYSCDPLYLQDRTYGRIREQYGWEMAGERRRLRVRDLITIIMGRDV